MHADVRPTVALTAAATIMFGSALSAAPAALLAAPPTVPALATVTAQDVALAGFIADIYDDIEPVVAGAVGAVADLISVVPIIGPPIADQIDILYTYGEQAVAGTVYWVDDLVTPLINGQFWPLSGAPGNYIAGAIDSTIDWAGGLVNTAVGFVEAEINYFLGWVPNIPNLINDIVSGVVNTVQDIINWVIGWIPGPLAAVTAPSAAAATVAVSRGTAESPAPAALPAAAASAAEAAPQAAVGPSADPGEASVPVAVESPAALVAERGEAGARESRGSGRSSRSAAAAAADTETDTDDASGAVRQSRGHTAKGESARAAAATAR